MVSHRLLVVTLLVSVVWSAVAVAASRGIDQVKIIVPDARGAALGNLRTLTDDGAVSVLTNPGSLAVQPGWSIASSARQVFADVGTGGEAGHFFGRWSIRGVGMGVALAGFAAPGLEIESGDELQPDQGIARFAVGYDLARFLGAQRWSFGLGVAVERFVERPAGDRSEDLGLDAAVVHVANLGVDFRARLASAGDAPVWRVGLTADNVNTVGIDADGRGGFLSRDWRAGTGFDSPLPWGGPGLRALLAFETARSMYDDSRPGLQTYGLGVEVRDPGRWALRGGWFVDDAGDVSGVTAGLAIGLDDDPFASWLRPLRWEFGVTPRADGFDHQWVFGLVYAAR